MMGSKAVMSGEKKRYVRWFEEMSSADTNIVGGKNSSLGEMIRALKRKKSAYRSALRQRLKCIGVSYRRTVSKKRFATR
jgi:hypothetical protein